MTEIKRNNFQFNSDLSYKINPKLKLETGVKSNFQFFKSSANYYLNNNGSSVSDPIRTNSYNYREQIHAAYIQASQKLP